MHNADVASCIQDGEDLDIASWQSFYASVLASADGGSDVARSIGRILSSRRSSEDEDAKLLFHTFAFLSDYLSKSGDSTAVQEINEHLRKPRQPVNPQAVVLPHNATVDRVWNLLKVPEIGNPFNLTQAATKMAALNYMENRSLTAVLKANACIMTELGLSITKATLSSTSTDIPKCILEYLHRDGVSFPSESKSCIKAQMETLLLEVDDLLESSHFAATAILSKLARGLSISASRELRITNARLLIRLGRAHERMERTAEGILILDDIVGCIVSNCSHADIGLFHLVRAELLISLSNKATEESSDILCDALESLQFSIAAFDRSKRRSQLLFAVCLAAKVADGLQLESMRNYYAVKFLQIKAADEGMSEQFFPCNEGTGQPKIPSELMQSPKGDKKIDLGSPMSPVGSGRGLQTLIKWTHQ